VLTVLETLMLEILINNISYFVSIRFTFCVTIPFMSRFAFYYRPEVMENIAPTITKALYQTWEVIFFFFIFLIYIWFHAILTVFCNLLSMTEYEPNISKFY